VGPYGAELRDGRMYGRGVAVSKSDFATYAYALLALQAAAADGAKLGGAIELHFTYDEEVGGAIGPAWLLEQGLSKPDYALSAGFAYGITTAHNGCLHLEVEVLGKSGHAAEPDKGVDALEAANGMLADLYALRKTYTAIRSRTAGIVSPTLVVGLIEGGVNTNVVPDRVVFRLDRRIIPEENPPEVEATLIRSLHASAAKWPGVTVNVHRILLAQPFVPIPGQEVLVAAIHKNARAVMGEEIKAHGVPLYTDARHYSAAGVPTVLYGAGPRTLAEANGHRADENLKLDDLYKATEVVALSLYDLLAAKAP
jgi:succinyl-diaminopimelate desuccinylase